MIKVFCESIGYHGLDINYLVYPGGEVSITNPFPSKLGKVICIVARLENSNDLMALCLLKDILDRYNVQKVTLDLLYAPYARQDRVIPGVIGNQALSVKVFSNIINSLGFSKIYVVDPHSNVVMATLNNAVAITKELILAQFDFSCYDVFLAPDAGAMKEVSKLAEKYGKKFAYANKTRNPKTGYLEIDSIISSDSLESSSILVIDDICDGGMTFKLLADHLYDKINCISRLDLYVTHGIFSNGIKNILDSGYDNVMTYNLFDAHKDKQGRIAKKEFNENSKIYTFI